MIARRIDEVSSLRYGATGSQQAYINCQTSERHSFSSITPAPRFDIWSGRLGEVYGKALVWIFWPRSFPETSKLSNNNIYREDQASKINVISLGRGCIAA